MGLVVLGVSGGILASGFLVGFVVLVGLWWKSGWSGGFLVEGFW